MNFHQRHDFDFTPMHADAVALRNVLRESGYDRVGTTTNGGRLLSETFFKGNLRVDIDYTYFNLQPERVAV